MQKQPAYNHFIAFVYRLFVLPNEKIAHEYISSVFANKK